MEKGYRILAENCRQKNDTRKTGLNNNDLIIGPSGSGKTRGYVMPNLLQGNESMIITDMKGSLFRQMGGALEQEGYRVVCIDLTDCAESCGGYNPFDFIRYDAKRNRHVEQDIMTLSACIVPLENQKDPYWDMAARIFLQCLVSYVLECLPEEEQSPEYVFELFSEMGTKRFDLLMRELQELAPGSFAVNRYKLFRDQYRAEKMFESVRGILAEKLSVLSFPEAKSLFRKKDRISFADLGREKTAVFLTVSDTDHSMDRLADIFYTQALHTLCFSADRDYPENCLPVPVRFILDDFAAGTVIPDFDKITSVIRSRGISVSIILQSITQLEDLYGHAKARTILNNCDNCLYLGGQDVATAQYMSLRADKSVHTILNMPLGEAWLFTRGQKPKKVQKYDIKNHHYYDRLPENHSEHRGMPYNGHTPEF